MLKYQQVQLRTKDDTVTSPTQKPQQPEQQPEQKPEEDKDNKDDKEEDKDDKNDNVDNGNNGNNNGNNSNGSTSDKNDNNNSSNGTYKNGHYQVKNVVILDNPVGYSMVRGILNETSNVEIKDGKYYLTLEIGQK